MLIFHAGIWGGLNVSAMHVLGYGHLGVDLFFVISGFCMVWPLERRGGNLDPVDFWKRRFVRVAVPFWIVLVAAIATSWLVYEIGGPSWWSGVPKFQAVFPLHGFTTDLSTHLVLVHGLFPKYAHSIDGAFWSLSTEWQFYLAFPALWWASRKWSPKGVAAAGLIGAWVFAGVVVNVLHANLADALLPWYLGTFCVGMLAASIKTPRARAELIAAGVCAAIVVVPLEWYKGVSYWAARPLWALAFGALVTAAKSGPLASALSTQPMRRLGLCSYSAYLIHGTIFQLISIPITRWGGWSVGPRTLVYFAAIGPVVLAAWWFFRQVEEPAHRYARRRFVGTRPSV